MSPQNSKLYDEAYKELCKGKGVTIPVHEIVNLAMDMAREEGKKEGAGEIYDLRYDLGYQQGYAAAEQDRR